jgi:hypothetical protein
MVRNDILLFEIPNVCAPLTQEKANKSLLEKPITELSVLYWGSRQRSDKNGGWVGDALPPGIRNAF